MSSIQVRRDGWRDRPRQTQLGIQTGSLQRDRVARSPWFVGVARTDSVSWSSLSKKDSAVITNCDLSVIFTDGQIVRWTLSLCSDVVFAMIVCARPIGRQASADSRSANRRSSVITLPHRHANSKPDTSLPKKRASQDQARAFGYERSSIGLPSSSRFFPILFPRRTTQNRNRNATPPTVSPRVKSPVE